MLKLIEFFKDGIETIFNIIRGFAGVVVSLISVLGKCFSFMGTIIGHLPPLFTFSVTTLVIVCILYKILGREGQD